MTTNFGKNLKFLRRLNGLSQTDLAKVVGLNRSNIASYESSMVEPSIKNFLALCEYFCIEHREILEENLLDHPTSTKPIVSKSKPIVDQYVKEQMDAFIIQTNEMTKIFEGYKLYLDMIGDDEYKREADLYGSLDDLLNLLRSLIQTNWHLIQGVLPDFEEEDCG